MEIIVFWSKNYTIDRTQTRNICCTSCKKVKHLLWRTIPAFNWREKIIGLLFGVTKQLEINYMKQKMVKFWINMKLLLTSLKTILGISILQVMEIFLVDTK